MNAGTASERIFDFCRILVGRMRGGLAQVDILVSVIFSGMSGSAVANAAGPGLVTIKQMLKNPEYSRGFTGAVVVRGGGQRHAGADHSAQHSHGNLSAGVGGFRRLAVSGRCGATLVLACWCL